VVVLLLSEEGLKQTTEAHIRPDNQLLEIELALERMRETEKTDIPVYIFPIRIKSKIGSNASVDWFPTPNQFPKSRHCHRVKPNQRMTVQETFQELAMIQSRSIDEDKIDL
jgi:hypothetical protein